MSITLSATVTEYAAGGGPSVTRDIDAPHRLYTTFHIGSEWFRVIMKADGLLIESSSDLVLFPLEDRDEVALSTKGIVNGQAR